MLIGDMVTGQVCDAQPADKNKTAADLGKKASAARGDCQERGSQPLAEADPTAVAALEETT